LGFDELADKALRIALSKGSGDVRRAQRRGSEQSPRMNPYPLVRPVRGSKKKIGRGDRPVCSEPASEDRGMPILFLLGVPGQSPRTPENRKRDVA
jgi:hypothetical protein